MRAHRASAFKKIKNKIDFLKYNLKEYQQITNKMSQTQLTSADGYNAENMIFSEPQIGTIPNSTPAISFKRVNISTKNPDGSVGELIISTEEVFSFGVSENVNPDTGKTNGYVLPLCLYNRDGVTPYEKAFVDTFNKIVEKCKDHLLDNKEEIEQYDLERNDLKKLNCLYYKRDKGKVVEGTGPVLYAKLITSNKKEGDDKIVSMFFNKEGENMKAVDLIGKYCFVRAAIKIESIFIGNKISLQVKLYEAEVRLSNTGMVRLLPRPQSDSRVSVSTSSSGPTLTAIEEEPVIDDDASSLLDMDEDDKPPSPVPVKKVVKKVIKKVAKKGDE